MHTHFQKNDAKKSISSSSTAPVILLAGAQVGVVEVEVAVAVGTPPWKPLLFMCECFTLAE